MNRLCQECGFLLSDTHTTCPECGNLDSITVVNASPAEDLKISDATGETRNNPPNNESVVINGVKWATRNVDKPGTFAAKPEDSGMFYQWNRKKAWSATDDVSGWDNSVSNATQWEKANDPSPAGWHVPTLDEIKKLLDIDKVRSEWTIQNGINGRKFTEKTTGNSLFLSAAGYCGRSGGTLHFVGSTGHYWSSTQYGSGDVYDLHFGSNNAGWGNSNHGYGQFIRAVAE